MSAEACVPDIPTLRNHIDKLTFIGWWGMSIVDGSGEEIVGRDQQCLSLPAGRTMDLPVAAYAFANAEPSEMVQVHSPPLAGDGLYDAGRVSLEELRLEEAVEDMVVRSGITSTVSLIRHLGDRKINDYSEKELHTSMMRTYLVQREDGNVEFKRTTAADMVEILKRLKDKAPGLMDLMQATEHEDGVRRYLPPESGLVVGSKQEWGNNEGLRHEVGFISREDSDNPKDTLYYALLSESKVPRLTAGIIALIGSEIFEHYFGLRAVPILGRMATSFLPGSKTPKMSAACGNPYRG